MAAAHPSASPTLTLGKYTRRVFSSAVSSASQPSFSFTICTYNTLAQGLVNRAVFPNAPSSALKWKPRGQRLLDEIKALDADIVCLQEVDQSYWASFWVPGLTALGYELLNVAKKTGVAHSCALGFKKAKFEQVKYQEFFYAEELAATANNSTPTTSESKAAPSAEHQQQQTESQAEPGPRSEAPASDSKQQLEMPTFEELQARELARPNVAQMIALHLKSDSSQGDSKSAGVVVSNTHLHWNPHHAYVRLRQCEVLLQNVHAFRNEFSWPVVMAGDFNVTPDNAVCAFLTSRHRFADFLSRPSLLPPLDVLKHMMDPETRNGKGSAPKNEVEASGPAQSSADSSITIPASWKDIRLADISQRVANCTVLPLLRSCYANYTNVAADAYRAAGDADSLSHLEEDMRNDMCKWSGDPSYTTIGLSWRGTTDYLFLEGGSLETAWKVEPVEWLEVPHSETVTALGGMPSDILPSDHFPLRVRLHVSAV